MIGSDGKRTNARSDRSLTNVNQIDLKVHALVKPLVPMKNGRGHKSVYCKGAVYVFTDDRRDDNLAVEKYCLQANTWTHVSDKFDYRIGFCVCAVVDKIFVIVGEFASYFPNLNRRAKVLFDARHKYITTRMNDERAVAGCALPVGSTKTI